MNVKFALVMACGMAAFGSKAMAQDHTLHFAQAGAQIQYSEAQLQLLFAAINAKEFDLKFTKDTVQELRRAVGDAKRRVDKAEALLPEKYTKHTAKLTKLRDAIKVAEDSLQKLANDIDEQTGAMQEGEDDDGELGVADEEAEPKQVDWTLLKTRAGWFGVDLRAAKGMQRKLMGKLGIRGLKYPPKPRGKRPE